LFSFATSARMCYKSLSVCNSPETVIGLPNIFFVKCNPRTKTIKWYKEEVM
jgi:hypothetical protein